MLHVQWVTEADFSWSCALVGTIGRRSNDTEANRAALKQAMPFFMEIENRAMSHLNFNASLSLLRW